jgi:NAD(P)-dependent dehydrogenase (short-subunit alcohol dehydrogenase family)
MGLLKGKVALITGAGGGLGEAYAKLFAHEGAAVVVNDLGVDRHGKGESQSRAEKVVAAIQEAGGKAVANHADISTVAGATSLFEDAMRHFGRADILVNNAGILRDRTFAKSNVDDWDKVMEVHLRGTYCATLPVFQWMRDNGGGVIVNTSSGSGLIGNFGQSNYGAAKAGIWGFSNVLAIEGRKHKIRVWTIAPSAVTRMTDDHPEFADDLLSPEDNAQLVLYMVSELSGDQTGKVVHVSGRTGLREMRLLGTKGWKPKSGSWNAHDLAEHAHDVLFPDDDPL